MKTFNIKSDYQEMLKIVKYALKSHNSEDNQQQVFCNLIELNTQNITLKDIYKQAEKVLNHTKYEMKKEKLLISLDQIDENNFKLEERLSIEDVQAPASKATGSINLVCPVCNKRFKRYMSDLTKSKNNYCSRVCRESGKRINKIA